MRFLTGSLGCFLVVLIGFVSLVLIGLAVAPMSHGIATMWDPPAVVDPTYVPGWSPPAPGAVGFSASWGSMAVLFMVLFAAILALFGLVLLSRSGPRVETRQAADEGRMAQELYHRSVQLEERLESLETLLIRRERGER